MLVVKLWNHNKNTWHVTVILYLLLQLFGLVSTWVYLNFI